MMSAEYRRTLQMEAAQEAEQAGLTPHVFATHSEVDEAPPFPIPFIGDYEPEGWVKRDEHFVDSSGFGEPGEPALTGEQFIELIHDRMREHADEGNMPGWAITEVGQFQVYVGEFTRSYDAVRRDGR